MGSKTHHDAIDLLDAEHDAVARLFAHYKALADHDAPGARRKALADQICLELTIHARLEEELVYPPAREAIRDDDLLDEAEVEHASAKDLIAQILAMGANDELYDAKVTVLGEYIAHHVKEEREQLFPKLRACAMDLAELGRRLRARRKELDAVPEALREEARISVPA